MRHAILAGLALLLFGAGIASAQTAATPAPSAAPAAEPGRFTISAEALLWWFKDSPAPVPLVTNGLVGQPGTKTYLGGDELDTGANPGFRFNAGYTFTDRWSVESSFFYVPSRSTSNSVSSSGKLDSTDLIVPYIDAPTGRENGTEISFSPIYRGSATETLSNSLMGVDLNAAYAVKLAMGAMVQQATISGSLVTNDFTNFNASQTFSGGYFALPSNIGSYSRTVFAVLPEIGLNLGYQITSWMSVFAGYTFLYTNNVLRPGNQISRTVNTSQSTSYTEDPNARLQGPAQPSFKFNSSDFWAQGLNVGLAFRF